MSCRDLKKGDEIVCEGCGLVLKVKKACNCSESESGVCSEGGFTCCGGPMKVK